ncbi:MAG TPA: SufS family cysteine desulfurase [Patescibacteria group bacterium]|nr:SufS family cysteine desulfurase [Patescibacteria group bacterium]
MFNIKTVKKDFPIFTHHPDLVYLDSAATSLKPQSVIDKITEYYSHYSVNIHRGIYALSEKATQEYEETRKITAEFIGAKDQSEIIFTRNATESLNLIAYSLGYQLVSKNDEIVTTVIEHHSNFVPWQILASEKNAIFKVIDINDEGELKIKNEKGKMTLDHIITKKTKILTLTYISNVLGVINPIKEIVKAAKEINPSIVVIVDGTKAIPHIKINVYELGCDFFVFSAHKMLGPTGVGVLWGKIKHLNSMRPFNYGGGTIREVSIEKTVFKDVPDKFEAGTPHIAGVIAFKRAIEYLSHLGMENIAFHTKMLTSYTFTRLQEEFGENIRFFVSPQLSDISGIVSFVFKNFHPHDIAQIADEENIAIRAGHHCAMPLHTRLGITATVRASFYIYNDEEDVEKLIKGLKKAQKILG